MIAIAIILLTLFLVLPSLVLCDAAVRRVEFREPEVLGQVASQAHIGA